jgi:hypothetical protein
MRSTVVFTASCMAVSVILGSSAAGATGNDIRSITADPYGNGVIITSGGAKIIAVGRGDLADGFEPPAIITENCREIGIVLKGRSFMYGVSEGDPVPRATEVVCD